MQDRISISNEIKAKDGALIIAIDENEFDNLSLLLKNLFPNYEKNFISIIHNPAGIQGDNFSYSHEYCVYAFNKQKIIGKTKRKNDSEESFRDWGGTSSRSLAKNCFYPIFVKDGNIIGFGDVCDVNFHPEASNIVIEGVTHVYPISSDGVERKWVFSRQSVESIAEELFAKHINGEIAIKRTKSITSYKTVWDDKKFYANIHGSKFLKHILGSKKFDFPKSVYTVKECIYALKSVRNKNSLVLDYFAGSGTTSHAVLELNREDQGKRHHISVEMGTYFDKVTRPRIQKVIYSKDWKNGKPVSRVGISHAFKYIRLESYEDTLNNISFKEDSDRDQALHGNDDFRRDYMLKYWLELEAKDSASLLNINQLDDPTSYMLTIKRPGSDEYEEKNVDLVESFNWLIGLHVDHLDKWRRFSASFKRETDPELPGDEAMRLIQNGPMKEVNDGKWLFRKVKGRIARTAGDMNNSDRVLVIWRKLTGNLEEDNLMLDIWFKENIHSTLDSKIDVIYVNGSNNLPNLRQDDEHWNVRLIEEAFLQKMWEVEE